MIPEKISIRQAAKYSGKSYHACYMAIQTGKLPIEGELPGHTGKRNRKIIMKEDFLNWLDCTEQDIIGKTINEKLDEIEDRFSVRLTMLYWELKKK